MGASPTRRPLQPEANGAVMPPVAEEEESREKKGTGTTNQTVDQDCRRRPAVLSKPMLSSRWRSKVFRKRRKCRRSPRRCRSQRGWRTSASGGSLPFPGERLDGGSPAECCLRRRVKMTAGSANPSRNRPIVRLSSSALSGFVAGLIMKHLFATRRGAVRFDDGQVEWSARLARETPHNRWAFNFPIATTRFGRGSDSGSFCTR